MSRAWKILRKGRTAVGFTEYITNEVTCSSMSGIQTVTSVRVHVPAPKPRTPRAGAQLLKALCRQAVPCQKNAGQLIFLQFEGKLYCLVDRDPACHSRTSRDHVRCMPVFAMYRKEATQHGQQQLLQYRMTGKQEPLQGPLLARSTRLLTVT